MFAHGYPMIQDYVAIFMLFANVIFLTLIFLYGTIAALGVRNFVTEKILYRLKRGFKITCQHITNLRMFEGILLIRYRFHRYMHAGDQ